MNADGAASAVRWWMDAGVDTLVAETPRDWLGARPQPTPATAPAMPETLDAFQAWLRESPELPFASPTAPRVGPSGDPAAGLMVIVDMPTPEDAAAGRLLAGGEAGALFDRMMQAIGRSRDSLYLAPLSPVRSPSGTLDAQSAATLAGIALRHIALVRPDALILFGDTVARALVGTAVAAARGRWHRLATPAGEVRTLVTIRPEKLVLQPGMKKLAWADLQLLLKGETP